MKIIFQTKIRTLNFIFFLSTYVYRRIHSIYICRERSQFSPSIAISQTLQIVCMHKIVEYKGDPPKVSSRGETTKRRDNQSVEKQTRILSIQFHYQELTIIFLSLYIGIYRHKEDFFIHCLLTLQFKFNKLNYPHKKTTYF